jgi:hypothetical protein
MGMVRSTLSAEQAAIQYADAYRKLYRRVPPECKPIDSEWVRMDGVPVRVSQLQELTDEIHSAYEQIVGERRRTVERLVEYLQQ